MKNKAVYFDAIAANTQRKKKKKGFIATVAEQYNKGRKVVDDYKAGSAERDNKAAENFKKKTALLKARTEHAKAKSAYQKAKGGKSMFGASFGGFEQQRSAFSGTVGTGDGLGGSYGAGSWGVGAKKAPMKRKKRAKKGGYKKKVVYYS